MRTNFVERINDKVFIVNAMSSKDAKRTQEEVLKALITKEALSLPTDAT